MPWIILHLWGFLCIRDAGHGDNRITGTLLISSRILFVNELPWSVGALFLYVHAFYLLIYWHVYLVQYLLILYIFFRPFSFSYSYFKKCCQKNVHVTIPKGNNYGISSIPFAWHCSRRTYFCCVPLALTNICPWPLVPFFQISLKNSALKTTHNTFQDCHMQSSDHLHKDWTEQRNLDITECIELKKKLLAFFSFIL